MPTYTYSAIDSRGLRVAGQIEASDPDAAVSQLTELGLRIENIQRVLPAVDVWIEEPRKPEMNAGDVREISGHIAEVVSAGLPLEGGLAAIAEEFPWGRMRRSLRRIVHSLESGSDLESALSASGAPPYLAALVRSGRRSGRTAEVLENYIAGSRSVSDMRQTLWMALAYPLVLMLLTFPLGWFLIFRLIPQFASIFEGFQIQLPGMTWFVITVSEFLAQHGGAVLLVVAGAIAIFGLIMRLALGPVGMRRLVSVIPVIGPLLRWLSLARFSPILSLLIESRVPLDESLLLAGDAAGDAEIRHDCRELAASVQAGATLASAASQAGRFPKSFVRALSWERNQEGFPEVLQSMSEMYAGRARALVAILIAVLPPLVVTCVALLFGFIVIAMFMPLIKLLNMLS